MSLIGACDVAGGGGRDCCQRAAGLQAAAAAVEGAGVERAALVVGKCRTMA